MGKTAPSDQRRNGIKQIYFVLIIAVIVIFIWLTAVISQTSGLPSVSPEVSANQFQQGWYYLSGGEKHAVEAFPAQVSYEGGEGVFYNVLPETGEGQSLMFSNDYQSVQVYVGETCIYDYGYENLPPLGNLLGNIKCFVPMKEEYSGEEISIHLKMNYWEEKAAIKSVYLDNTSDLIFQMLKSQAGLVLCLILMLLFCVALFACFVWARYKKITEESGVFLNLGLFVFLSAVWIWTDSSLPQLVFKSGIALCVTSFFSFMLLPVPMIGFVEKICAGKTRMFRSFQLMCLLNCAVQSIFYAAGIADYPQMLPVTHLLLAAVIIFIICYLIYDVRNHASYYAKGMLVAIGALTLFSFAALLNFYISRRLDNSLFFRMGFLLFILILGYMSVKMLLSYQEVRTQAAVYQKLAYTDLMTQVNNRSSFEEFIDGLNAEVRSEKNLTFIMLDLNGLKQTNDKYGHKAGDRLLQSAADCIKSAFGEAGTIYRIGGDEFFVAVTREDVNVEERLSYMDERIAEYNRRHSEDPFCLSIARGTASEKEYPDCGIDGLWKKADENMYREKAAFHSSR
ncbi:sensor domain-containing diguanylate cyclase [Qiania dongpingensis]|uniref:Diguanylate cyclase n=1 Tax=Qiania dongpingensis TaxID=2763669 RepID=A0A7G9G418_9FIRM|nr:diguanylate cyclase [Qiania dongpingensis]QNM05550.1 diguanylate cyclase [Qiania dongpingensis]